MKVDANLDGKVLMVTLEGEVDMSSSGDVWNAIAPHIEGKKPKAKACVVDLSKVSYMDSSGIATLVRTWQTVQKSGGKMRLAALSASVKDVFELAHVNEIFEIFDAVDDAMAGL
jgi:anti-sigma B factor antagonist